MKRIPLFEEFIAAGGANVGATPQNTPGMGNVRVGTIAGGAESFHNGTPGSGDILGMGSSFRNRKKRKKRRS